MKQEKYIGHSSQISGVEEYRCLNGKSDGMHVLHIRNGLGMELMINADRCADISRLSLDGKNLSYTSVVGNVAPDYFSIDSDGFGFLKSFNCGFITTCGFDNILTKMKVLSTVYMEMLEIFLQSTSIIQKMQLLLKFMQSSKIMQFSVKSSRYIVLMLFQKQKIPLHYMTRS